MGKSNVLQDAPKRIKQLQFSVFSPQEVVQLAEFEVTHRDLYVAGEGGLGKTPAPGGLLDRRLVSTLSSARSRSVGHAEGRGWLHLSPIGRCACYRPAPAKARLDLQLGPRRAAFAAPPGHTRRTSERATPPQHAPEPPSPSPPTNGPSRRLASHSQGVSDKQSNCETCHQKMADCVGHYAYIKLVLPVFHIGYFKQTITMLQDICKVRRAFALASGYCGERAGFGLEERMRDRSRPAVGTQGRALWTTHLAWPRESRTLQSMLEGSDALHELFHCQTCAHVLLSEEDRRLYLSRFRRPNLENLQRQSASKAVNTLCRKVVHCPHCGATNGTVKKIGALKIVHEKYRAKKVAGEHEEFLKTFGNAVREDAGLRQHVRKAQEDLNPLRVLELFKRISAEVGRSFLPLRARAGRAWSLTPSLSCAPPPPGTQDCELLGLHPDFGRPEEYIWQYISVPPVCIRPSVAQDGATCVPLTCLRPLASQTLMLIRLCFLPPQQRGRPDGQARRDRLCQLAHQGRPRQGRHDGQPDRAFSVASTSLCPPDPSASPTSSLAGVLGLPPAEHCHVHQL
jgi:hypothetical protein